MVDVVKTAQDAANTVNQAAQTVETKEVVAEGWVSQHPRIALAIAAAIVVVLVWFVIL
jgi:ElaB/YqjD/DUF883 family membrane-anchored ribosome-binding protein